MAANPWEVVHEESANTGNPWKVVSEAPAQGFGLQAPKPAALDTRAWQPVKDEPTTAEDYVRIKQSGVLDIQGVGLPKAAATAPHAKPVEGSPLTGALETAAHEVSGFVANTIGAYAHPVNELGKGLHAAYERGMPEAVKQVGPAPRPQVNQADIDKLVSTLTYEPKTERGKAYTHTVELPFQKWQQLAKSAGQQVTAKTGSEFAGEATTAALANAPYIILPELGLRYLKGFKRAGAPEESVSLGGDFGIGTERGLAARKSSGVPGGEEGAAGTYRSPATASEALKQQLFTVDGKSGTWRVESFDTPQGAVVVNTKTGERAEVGPASLSAAGGEAGAGVKPRGKPSSQPQPTPPVAPTPEAPATIAAQLEAFKAGRKPAVLFTPGESIPGDVLSSAPRGAKIADIPGVGRLLYTDPETLKLARSGRMGDALGYGVPEKPAAATQVVTARNDAGTPIQDVAVTPETHAPVTAAAEQVAGPQGSVETRPIEGALQERSSDRQEELSAPPAVVQRFEEPGRPAGTVDKPQGLYTTPADVDSPHAELSGDKTTRRTNPNARVLRVVSGNDVGMAGMRRGSKGESAGIAALRALDGGERVHELGRLSKKDLMATVKREYPAIDWSRYQDAQELLEGYAGMRARDAGYDAIWATDTEAPEFSEYVALTPKAFQDGIKRGAETSPSFELTNRPDGTLKVVGDRDAIRAQLQAVGLPAKGIPSRGGLTFGRSQAQRVRAALEGGKPETEVPASVEADPRLKRADYRARLDRAANELTPGGDMGIVGGDFSPAVNAHRARGQETGVRRLPSINPQWFQTLAADEHVTVKEVKTAVSKALAGERLGARQQRVVRAILDDITDERTAPENMIEAQRQRRAARDLRRAAQQGREVPTTGAYREADAHPGEAFDETEYDPQMSGEARGLFELNQEAGSYDPDSVERIEEDNALGKITNAQAARQYWTIIERGRKVYGRAGGRTTGAEVGEEPASVSGDEEGQRESSERAPAGVSQASQGDLIGGKTDTQQALHNETLRRDQARNRGQESVETGNSDDLFSQARRQRNLEGLENDRENTHLPSEQPRGARGPVKGAPPGQRSAAGVPAESQLELFAPQDTAPAEKAQLARRTGIRQIGALPSGIDHATTPEDVAHVVASIRKMPQERVLAIVTGDDGKILTVIQHTIGTRNESSVDVGLLASHIHAIDGGKRVWFAHNHPGGNPIQSRADAQITDRLDRALNGTGVMPMGMIVVAPGGKMSYYLTHVHSGGGEIGQIPAKARTKGVPITTRQFTRGGSLQERPLVQPSDAIEFAIQHLDRDQTGLILLDNHHQPVGFVPMTIVQMEKLRDGDQTARRLYRAMADANPTALIIKAPSANDRDALNNIARFARDTNLRLLDTIFPEGEAGYASRAQRGLDDPRADDQAFFSRIHNGVFHRYDDLGQNIGPVSSAWVDIPKLVGFKPPFELHANHALPEWMPARFDPEEGVVEFNSNLSIPRSEAAQYLVEEVLHGVDAVAPNRTLSAGSPLFGPDGGIRKEAHALYAQGAEFGAFLDYPLNPEYGYTESRIKAELFARLGTLYLGDPELMRSAMPKTYEVYHDIFALSPESPTTGAYVFGKVWSTTGGPSSLGREHGAGSGTLQGRGGGSETRSRDLRRRMAPLRKATAKALGTHVLGTRVQFGNVETRISKAKSGRDRLLAARQARVDQAGGRTGGTGREPPALKRGVASETRPNAGFFVSPAEQIKAHVAKLMRGWAKRPPVEVVRSESDLPKPIRDKIEREGAHGEIKGVYWKGKVYVVAENVAGLKDAETVIFHEIFGHHGLREILGDELDPVLNRVWLAYGRKGLADIADRYGLDLSKKRDRLTAAEEKLAHMAQTGEKPSILERLYALIRRWARRMGFSHLMKLGNSDIRSLLARARAYVERGERPDGVFLERSGLKQRGVDGAEGAAEPAYARSPKRIRYTTIKGTEIRPTEGQTLQQAAIAWARKHLQGKQFHNDDTRWEISITRKGINKTTSHAAKPEQAQSIVALPELIKHAVRVSTDANRDAASRVDVPWVHTFYAPLTIGDTDYLVKLVVKETRQGQKFYDHDLTEIEEPAKSSADAHLPKEGAATGNSTGRTMSIDRLMHLVNPDGDDIRFSRKHHDEATEAALEKAGLTRQSRLRSALDLLKLVTGRAGAELREELSDETIQGSLDRFHGLKRAEERVAGALPIEQSAYAATRFSTGSGTIMTGVLTHGTPEWRDGISQKKPGTKGLLEVLHPVKDDLREFFGWMTGRRAERLKAEGRENLFTDEDVKHLKALGTGKQAKFTKVARDYDRVRKDILDFAQEAGLIDATTRPAWDRSDHIPFYRVGAEGVAGPGKGARGLSGQSSGIRTLKGGSERLNDPLENIIMNFTRLIDASMKNHAIRLAADILEPHGVMTKEPAQLKPEMIPMSEVRRVLKEQGVDVSMLDPEALRGVRKMMSFKPPADPDVVRVMREGKPVYYRVHDPLLLRSLTAVNAQALGGVMRPLRFFSRLLTGAVTSTPDFQMRNFSRDTLSAYVISEANFIPVWDGFRGWYKSYRQQGGFEDMMFMGASFAGGHVGTHDPKRAARLIRRALRAKGFDATSTDRFMATIVDTPVRLWDIYRELSEAAENANREAIYEGITKAGGSQAKGGFEAKDIMDFSMHGDWKVIQILKDALPFFNARLQGEYKLGRSGAIPIPGHMRARAVVRGGTIMLASLALWWLNHDNPEYQGLPDWDKDTYWHIFTENNHYRIPKPFEVGTLYATIPERWADYMTGKNDADKLFDRFLWNTEQVLAFNPIPQAFRPAFEIYVNKNMFTGRAIESESDQGKLPADRYSAHTSPTLVEAGKVVSNPLNFSPKKMETVIRGYTGSMGMYLLSLADVATRWATDAPVQPALRTDQYPVLKSFIRGSAPPVYTQWMDDLYRLRDQANQVHGSIRAKLKEGDAEAAEQLQSENEETLSARDYLNRAGRKLSKIRHQITQVENNTVLSAEEKRKQIDALYAERNQLSRKVMENVEASAE